MIGLLVASALALSGVTGTLDGLSLHLSTTKATLLVGEPAKVYVTWTTTRPLNVDPDRVDIVLLGPDGTIGPWRETNHTISTTISIGRDLKPGEQIRTMHVLGATGMMRQPLDFDLELAFPIPGTYRLRAQYSGVKDAVASNWLMLTVKAPTGSDARLFDDVIRKKPWLVTVWVDLFSDELSALVAAHPQSPYLERARVHLWRNRIESAVTEAAEPPSGAPVRGRVPSVLAEIAAASLPPPFDEDRLLLLAYQSMQLGWPDQAAVAWREYLEKYPDGQAADQARRYLDRSAAR